MSSARRLAAPGSRLPAPGFRKAFEFCRRLRLRLIWRSYQVLPDRIWKWHMGTLDPETLHSLLKGEQWQREESMGPLNLISGRDLIVLLLVLLLVGVGIGGGCQLGCSWVSHPSAPTKGTP